MLVLLKPVLSVNIVSYEIILTAAFVIYCEAEINFSRNSYNQI